MHTSVRLTTHAHRYISYAIVGAIVAVGSSCGSDSAAPEVSIEQTTEAPSDDTPLFVRTTDGDGGDPDTAESAETAETVDGSTADDASASATSAPTPGGTTASIPTIPVTGVPGIDSTDAFCRAWSEFAGSFQALGLASAVGDPDNSIRLEVIASSAIFDAVGALDENLPDVLEAERSALVDDFAGPLYRRAGRAITELEVAGVGNYNELGDAWLTQLAAAGLDDPNLVVAVPASVDSAGLAAAVAAFAAQVPGIVNDPSLTTDASIPLTEAHLAANCPDQGILSGNDVINNAPSTVRRQDDVSS